MSVSSLCVFKGNAVEGGTVVAVSADVSSNYLTLAGTQLIQTRSMLCRNEGREGEEKRCSEGKKGNGKGGRQKAGRKREKILFPVNARSLNASVN